MARSRHGLYRSNNTPYFLDGASKDRSSIIMTDRREAEDVVPEAVGLSLVPARALS